MWVRYRGFPLLTIDNLSIGHYLCIKLPSCPYEWRHFELCEGDWFVSLKPCMGLEGVNILTCYIQFTGVSGPPPWKTAIRQPRRRQWFRQRNGKAYLHVEINVHRFYVDGASSRLFWSTLWHLRGECNRWEPFPVSALLLMNTSDWRIYTYTHNVVYTVRMVLPLTAAPCSLRESPVLFEPLELDYVWSLRVSQEKVVPNSSMTENIWCWPIYRIWKNITI